MELIAQDLCKNYYFKTINDSTDITLFWLYVDDYIPVVKVTFYKKSPKVSAVKGISLSEANVDLLLNHLGEEGKVYVVGFEEEILATIRKDSILFTSNFNLCFKFSLFNYEITRMKEIYNYGKKVLESNERALENLREVKVQLNMQDY